MSNVNDRKNIQNPTTDLLKSVLLSGKSWVSPGNDKTPSTDNAPKDELVSSKKDPKEAAEDFLGTTGLKSGLSVNPFG